jgi:hypothetical protein
VLEPLPFILGSSLCLELLGKTLRGRVLDLTLWVLQGLAALVFLYFGAIKLDRREVSWVELFARIGIGQPLGDALSPVPISPNSSACCHGPFLLVRRLREPL